MDNALERAYPRSRWYVLATIFVGYLALGMAIVMYSPIVGTISDEFSITPGEVSLLAIASFSIASAIASAVAGIIFDKVGWVIPFAIATVVMAAGIILTPYVTSTVTGILITRILVGIASGPITSCIANIAAEWFPAKERGTFNGIVSMGITVGMMLTFQIVGRGMGMYQGDWRRAESGLIFGPIAAIIVMIIMIFVIRKAKSALPPMDTYHAEGAEETIKHDYTYVLKQPVYYLILAGMVCYGWVMNSWNDLIPGYLAIDAPVGIGRGAEMAGYLMTFTQVGSLLGGFCAGILIDRIFKGRIRPILIFAYIVMGIAVLSVRSPLVYNNDNLFHVCLFLVGFCMTMIIPSLSNFVARTFPGAIVGKVFATTFGVALLIASVGVTIGSTLLHITGTYQVPILLVGIVALVGIIPALTIYKPQRFLPEGATKKDMRRC